MPRWYRVLLPMMRARATRPIARHQPAACARYVNVPGSSRTAAAGSSQLTSGHLIPCQDDSRPISGSPSGEYRQPILPQCYGVEGGMVCDEIRTRTEPVGNLLPPSNWATRVLFMNIEF